MLEESTSPMPSGTKMSPMMKNEIMTAFGVKIGCHAGSFCCLNGLLTKRSGKQKNEQLWSTWWFSFDLLLFYSKNFH
jgi:hypothetical protein